MTTRFADRLFLALEPYAYGDAVNDNSLLEFLRAIGELYEEIVTLAYDATTGEEGWSILVDVDRVPSNALDWLSQFVGVVQISGLTDQQKKDRIVAREGFRRGTPAGMRAAAQVYLTGTKTVNILERDTGSAYHMAVQTYQSETPGDDIPTTNGITNPSFETNTTGWTPSNSTIARITTDAWHGTCCARMTATTTGPQAYFFNAIAGAPVPQQAHSASVYVKGEGVSIGKQILVRIAETGGAFGDQFGDSAPVLLTNAWQRITVTYTPVRADRTSLYFGVYSSDMTTGQTMLFDAAQLEAKSITTPFVIGSRAVGSGPVGAALRATKPAGVVMVYSVTLGQTYSQLKAGHPLYSQVKSFYTNYDGVRADHP